jgi:hypothetical protein
MDTHAVFVLVGESVSDHIQLPLSIFHNKIISKQFAYPSMLRDGRELLIENKLEGEMISLYEKCPTLEVGTPMTNSLHQSN